jgi:hypothetical protein
MYACKFNFNASVFRVKMSSPTDSANFFPSLLFEPGNGS